MFPFVYQQALTIKNPWWCVKAIGGQLEIRTICITLEPMGINGIGIKGYTKCVVRFIEFL